MHHRRTPRRWTSPALAAWAFATVLGAPAFVAVSAAQAPGPESFAKAPSTPLEFWDAADYLVRTGQPKLAVPYLNAFLNANPSDDVLLQIRDRYGVGSVLRLQDDPATRPLEQAILGKINDAVRRHATDPARLERAIRLLTQSRDEQNYAVDRLKEAGPFAIPALIRAIENPGLPPESRALIVGNMGRLDRSTVPPLVAALGAPNPGVAADAARALAAIGDPRAVPFLTYPASWAQASSLRDAARDAIHRITGKPFALQPKPPARRLADEAWKYHRHQVAFDSDPTTVWVWDGDAPAPVTVPKTVAESILGGRFAREALAIEPGNRSAQAALVSLALEKSVERDGVGAASGADPSGAFAAATAAGPDVLADVLKTAIRDGHGPLAAAAALALGRVADRDPAGTLDPVSPLVAALTAPDRRVQYAAASALVNLNPSRPFPGSSRVVPILSRFVANSTTKALVIDGNANRGNSVGATLGAIGYDPEVVSSGEEGFREASTSGDVEVILIEPSALQGAWNLRDTLANLRADSRTAGLPVLIYGGLEIRDRLATVLETPRTAFVVTPTDPAASRDMLNRQLAILGTSPLSADEQAGFAQGAAGLLAAIASRPNGPLAVDLPAAQPALVRALAVPATAPAAAAVLGDVPGVDAQGALADLLLDGSRPLPLRVDAGRALARSVQKFGPLLAKEQERKLVDSLNAEADPTLRSTLSSVYGALKPEPRGVGRRLQAFQPTRPAPANPPATAPAAAPAEAPANEETP